MTRPALTSDEITALAGPSTRLTYLVPFPQTTIATARVNGSLAYPIAQIPTTSESAGWMDVKRGMVVLIGTAAGLGDVARFRCRVDVASTGAISVGQFGTNDTGSVAFANPTAIANAQYITVINTRDIVATYPEIDYAGNTTASIYEDKARTDILQNLQPSPIVRIATNNERGGHYGRKVADGATVSITAVATVQHWPSSSSVVSYQWAYPASFTGVSGATSATLTATAPVGNHEISCTVTANYGAAFTAVRYIVICDDTTNPPIPIASVDSDSRSKTARRVSLGLNNTAVLSIPDGSGVIMWDQATWNGTDVPTATTTFVGWLSQIGFSTGGGLRQAGPEIIGVGEVLNMLTNASQLFEVTNIPTVWQQMGYSLATYNWVIWWLLTFRALNVLQLFNFYPYSVSASVGRMPSFDIGAGSILSQVQALAQRYRRGNVGSASDGSIFVTVPAHMIETGSRSGLTTRAALTASRVASVSYKRDIRPRVRQIDGQAFAWDGASALPTPLKSIVPERPGQGASDDTLGEQIVDSQTTLNAITGLYFEWVNNPIVSVTIVVPGNYDVLEPVEGTLVDVTIPAAYAPQGVEWNFDATVSSVNKRYLAGGATEMEVTVEPLTSGAAGKTVPVPPPGMNIGPDIPPFDSVFPEMPIIDWGPVITIDPATPTPLDPLPGGVNEYPDMYGGTDDGHAWKNTNGSFTDISPTSDQRTALGTGLQLVQDPWDYKRAFFIGTSGILRTNDITASSVVWTAYARYNVPDSGETDFDFTVDDYDWLATDYFGCDTTYTPGVGFVATPSGVAGISNLSVASRTITPTYITSIEMTYEAAGYFAGSTQNFAVAWNDVAGADGLESTTNISATTSPVTQTVTPNDTITTINLRGQTNLGGSDVQTGTVTITAVTVHWRGSDPFSAAPGFALDDETIIGAFQGYLNKKDAYCWLSKRTISAVDYVYFNRTLDNFVTRQQVQVATWITGMNYSIAVSPHNWRFVWVTAGDTAGSDAFVYRSSDGGGSFVVTSAALLAHGGQLWWNWSTSTPNTPNTSNVNVLIVRGLNGSNNLLIRKGLTGSDITIANGSGKYGKTPNSLYQLTRDGDFVRMVLQDNSVYKSSNFATSFSAAAGVTGTQALGVWQWPTDSAFGIVYGDETLSYTIDTYATYTNAYTGYDTFRSGAYSAGGTVIIGAWIDLGQHYIRPVASEA